MAVVQMTKNIGKKFEFEKVLNNSNRNSLIKTFDGEDKCIINFFVKNSIILLTNKPY